MGIHCRMRMLDGMSLYSYQLDAVSVVDFTDNASNGRYQAMSLLAAKRLCSEHSRE